MVMRYAELVLDPGPAGFHPADRQFVESAAVERVAIHHLNQLDDGTIVFLYQLRGDPEQAKAILSEESDILAYSLSREDTALHAYVHVDPNETVETVFRLPQEHSLVIETPIECLPGGALRVSVLGDQATFTEALDTVPDAFEVELETIREYSPNDRQLYSLLTERQQEILDTAIRAGYYDQPRTATYEDVAEQLDLAPVTVGEHLRKIEARILTEIAPAGVE
jgi:predicted DNA binding protein